MPLGGAEKLPLPPEKNKPEKSKATQGFLFPEYQEFSPLSRYQSGSSPCSDDPDSVDLILGDNSSRNSDVEEGEPSTPEELLDKLLLEHLVPAKDQDFLRDYWRRKKEKVGTPRKLVMAYKRLKNSSVCGVSGHLMAHYSSSGELKKVSLVPYRCRSVQCCYCNFYDSRKRMGQISDYFSYLVESFGWDLTFISLTIPNEKDIFTAIEKINRAFQRLYQFRLFGKRNWQRVVREFRRETIRYYWNLRRKGLSPREALRRVKWQIELFRRFEKATVGYSHETKFGQIFKAVWKFELTYDKETGFHPHWHGITTLHIPKLLLTVLSKLTGFGEVCDIRRVRGREAIKELGKYVSKCFELHGLSFERKLDVEIAMHSFRKLRVWNISKEELLLYSNEEKEDLEVVPLPTLSYSLRGGKSLAELFRLERELEEGIPFSAVVDNDTVLRNILVSQEVPCEYVRTEVSCTFDDDRPYQPVCGITEELKEVVRQGFSDFLTFLWLQGYSGAGVERLEKLYRRAYSSGKERSLEELPFLPEDGGALDLGFS